MCREFLLYRPDAAELLDAARAARDSSPLPELTGRDAAEALLVSILSEWFRAVPPRPLPERPTP